jgi:hypothetical protein
MGQMSLVLQLALLNVLLHLLEPQPPAGVENERHVDDYRHEEDEHQHALE